LAFSRIASQTACLAKATKKGGGSRKKGPKGTLTQEKRVGGIKAALGKTGKGKRMAGNHKGTAGGVSVEKKVKYVVTARTLE